jgi:hypothetical protein
VQGKETRAGGGVLARHESVESGVDTSASHQGTGHDSTDVDKWWMVAPGLGCAAGRVSWVGLGDNRVGLVAAGLAVVRLGRGKWAAVARRKIGKKRRGAGPVEKTPQEAWREKKVFFYFKPFY